MILKLTLTKQEPTHGFLGEFAETIRNPANLTAAIINAGVKRAYLSLHSFVSSTIFEEYEEDEVSVRFNKLKQYIHLVWTKWLEERTYLQYANNLKISIVDTLKDSNDMFDEEAVYILYCSHPSSLIITHPLDSEGII